MMLLETDGNVDDVGDDATMAGDAKMSIEVDSEPSGHIGGTATPVGSQPD